MSWKMKCMDEKYLTKSLDLVERVFTESENAESGNTVRRLVEEIRSKQPWDFCRSRASASCTGVSDGKGISGRFSENDKGDCGLFGLSISDLMKITGDDRS